MGRKAKEKPSFVLINSYVDDLIRNGIQAKRRKSSTNVRKEKKGKNGKV